jgi:hypothetical protein
MKKLLLLLSVLSLVLTSCSSDDDNNDSSQELLIGTWTYFKAFEDGVEIVLSDCEKQETQVFNIDGTFSITEFDDFDGPCVQDGTFSGTWVNSGNGNYTVTAFGQTFSQAITFDGDTYSVVYLEDDGSGIIEYIDTYIKS